MDFTKNGKFSKRTRRSAGSTGFNSPDRKSDITSVKSSARRNRMTLIIREKQIDSQLNSDIIKMKETTKLKIDGSLSLESMSDNRSKEKE